MCAYPLRKELQGIPAFLPAKPASEANGQGRLPEIRLAANENTLGFSPLAAAAIQNSVSRLYLYPDSQASGLRSKLAAKLGTQPDQLVFGNGSFELLSLAAYTFLAPGEEALLPSPSFGWYRVATLAAGGLPVTVPLRNHAIDLEEVERRITPSTGLIWLCNPNNPTGSYFTAKELQRFLDRVPPHVFVVLDEAYREYAERGDEPDTSLLTGRYPNIAVLRTFSKAYGLAGLRIGYAIAAADAAAALNRLRVPPNLGILAEAAAAASLDDEPFLQAVLDNNRSEKQRYYEAFELLGLPCLPSETNFVMVNLGRDSGPVFDRLLQEGILVRPGRDFEMPTWLRITIGRPEENQAVLEKLEKALQASFH
ncbi:MULTISPECIES: histidinol-phosphate transaminase [unclassified Paenibacillus]|uniref:histidinol-phosphate transaminase n=1 Tax=unclassified Paenibacillus TaxID=185978 RepID=UPI0009552180|nr:MULTISPECIES: histidinol-phosphate transaminase [unclassified Paenibacillus]ASS64922.1 histidinol-phosphate transaminase [Paenibacillus sp. RUD330]SIR01406.1 histidinol-phosphate aminotransferase [Paenibacillus sp. RU4X]SIR33666.1 histidinol-phosphate aminotransferase [Paenibacillus sp. RU4T]